MRPHPFPQRRGPAAGPGVCGFEDHRQRRLQRLCGRARDRGVVILLIKIDNFEFSSVWDGVFYKKLSQYPAISQWEKRNIIEFVEYEALHGRECKIECENAEV
jgi:hypothetical protein